jgi:hypothetical protein
MSLPNDSTNGAYSTIVVKHHGAIPIGQKVTVIGEAFDGKLIVIANGYFDHPSLHICPPDVLSKTQKPAEGGAS